MRARVSKREILRRLEDVEARLRTVEAPLPGQESIDVATVSHTYTGPGARQDVMFGEACGAPKDAHQLVDEDD